MEKYFLHNSGTNIPKKKGMKWNAIPSQMANRFYAIEQQPIVQYVVNDKTTPVRFGYVLKRPNAKREQKNLLTLY